MKINSIKISNILSFEHHDDIEKGDDISFVDDINVIIGPMGSGKSNFLEIVNRLFKSVLIQEWIYNENVLTNYDTTKNVDVLKKTLRINSERKHSLSKNNKSKSNLKQIKIDIELNDLDRQNLHFLYDHAEEIAELSGKYSSSYVSFPKEIADESIIDKATSASFLFQDNGDGNFFVDDVTEPVKNLIFNYLRWFHFIQNLIPILNRREGKDWELLKNTFSIIGSNRSFPNVSSTITISQERESRAEELRNKLFAEGAKSYNSGEPIAFLLAKDKIIQAMIEKEIEFSRDGIKSDGSRTIELIDVPIYENINDKLEKYLELKLDIERKSATEYSFDFINCKTKKPINIDNLSSGQKELIHLIFAIYGYDLKNGLMIIDEPELHLHTQTQEQCLKIIQDAYELKLQFILATHSPIFVNPNTMNGLHRFYMENDFTKVVNPEIKVNEEKNTKSELDEKDLIRILDYTNSSKVFFLKKVILVEGDTDEYFYREFLDRYKKDLRVSENIGFLDIGGVPNFPIWKTFLTKCGIPVRFITDLDTILKKDFNILTEGEKEKLLNEFKNEKEIQNEISKNPEYEKSRGFKKKFLDFIKRQKTWKDIELKIEGKYNEGVFILKEGDLESYIGHTKSKGLSNVVLFCKSELKKWLESDSSKEIKTIFDKIIKL